MIVISNFSLSNESIAECVDASIEKYKVLSKKRAVKDYIIMIPLEEVLLKCKACYGSNATGFIKMKKHLNGDIFYEICIKADEKNPFSNNEIEENDVMPELLQRFGVNPKYEYIKAEGINKITIIAKQMPIKNKMLKQIFLAVILAVVCYFLTKILPKELTDILSNGFTVPIMSKIIKIIAAVATPLVFFSVLNGIFDIGDVSELGKMGKKIIFEALYTYLVAGTFLGVIGGSVYYNNSIPSTADGSIFEQIVTLILDIAPNNLIEPFLTDNDLQVICLSIFVGIILLFISKEMKIIPKFCFEAGNLVNEMMKYICKCLPFVVFLGIFNMLVSGELKSILSLYKMFIVFIAICIVILVSLTVRAHIVTKIPYKDMIRKQMDAIMVTLTTSSQMAALPINMDILKNRFKINGKLVDFSLPVLVVTYMPCGAVFLGLVAFALGDIAGVPLTTALIIRAVIVAIILAIAAPAIPGSAFVVMPIMFKVCGVPDEQYSLAIVIGTIIGYFLPMLNCYCLQLKILIAGKELDMINKD